MKMLESDPCSLRHLRLLAMTYGFVHAERKPDTEQAARASPHPPGPPSKSASSPAGEQLQGHLSVMKRRERYPCL